MEFNRLLSSAISTYGEIDFKDEKKYLLKINQKKFQKKTIF